MAHKTKIGGTAYEIGSGKVLVGGTGYSIDKGRTLVGGTGYDISFGTPIGSLAVGTSVFFNFVEYDEPVELIVIHQGNPDSTIYDSSCDGTWLLIKDILASMKFNSTFANNYKESMVYDYLNNSLITIFGSEIQSAIKTVKIPYTNGNGETGSLATGSDGLDVQMFLLSYAEVGFSGSSEVNIEGAVLDYFNGASDSDRIANQNGSATRWWLRSPYTSHNAYVHNVEPSGSHNIKSVTESHGIRPAFIMPSDFDVTNYLA